METNIGRYWSGKPAEQAPHDATKHESGPLPYKSAPKKHGHFAHALTIGVNVQFARIATNVATRQRFGRMTYPYAALETLVSHDALDIELEFDRLAIPTSASATQEQASPETAPSEPNTSLSCRALQVAIINAPIFRRSKGVCPTWNKVRRSIARYCRDRRNGHWEIW